MTAFGELGQLFKYIFTDFLQIGFRFLDSLSFTINGQVFSIFSMILGTLIFAVAFFLIKFLLGIQFHIGLSDYKAGRPHIEESIMSTQFVDKNGVVSSTISERQRITTRKVLKK